MLRKTLLLSLSLLGLLAFSACGGGETSRTLVTPSITPTPTATYIFNSVPTWTPVPSRTSPPPRATIEINYSRPTDTPFGSVSNPTSAALTIAARTAQALATQSGVLQQSGTVQPGTAQPATAQPVTAEAAAVGTINLTATPAPLGPTVTPMLEVSEPNPTITVTLDAFTTALATALSAQPLEALASTPLLQLQNGQLLIDALVYETTDEGVSAVPVSARVNILQVQGKPALSAKEAYYVSDRSPYTGDLTDGYLNLAEDVLTELVDTQYFAARPTDNGYFIATITVNGTAISFQTVSITGG